MVNGSRARRAAMGALVAVALVAGAEMASARPMRFSENPARRIPDGRARIVDDGGNAALARLKAMLASVKRFSEGGILPLRFPAILARRD